MVTNKKSTQEPKKEIRAPSSKKVVPSSQSKSTKVKKHERVQTAEGWKRAMKKNVQSGRRTLHKTGI